ncbi:MAG TPA: protein kinase [Blastocatellia bacterium]|nr:protein kinase [Blastocatellia bacterium]
MSRIVCHYRLLERLGSGGAGEVWKADDLKLNRLVAIKLLNPVPGGDDRAKERIQTEARMAAALSHPNIATVYELGETENGFYIAMEWVDGEDLTSRIARGPVDISESLDLAMQVADALGAAHRHGLVHCDVKSSNIMITPDGRAKVLDFGLARNIPAAALSHSCTGSHAGPEAFGTPGYMSPEQIRAEPLDPRTDVFSLGVVLFEMMTGNKPFEAHRPSDYLRAVMNSDPLPLSAFLEDVPLELESIVRRSLEKERGDRYTTVDELRAALRELSAELDHQVLRGSTLEDARSASPRQAADATDSPPKLRTRLQSLAWRFRKLSLFASVWAAGMAVWQILMHDPRGGGWGGVVAWLGVALAFGSARAAARQSRSATLQSAPNGLAFRGLVPFQEIDRNFFYGRETETARLVEMIRHDDFRFGVLFGESGCGKTSLLRAGVVPKLWEDGYAPVYCRSYKDPLEAALEECRRRSHLNRATGEHVVDYLARVAREFGATLVIICDQFEEFFISHKTRLEREPFLSFIASCHDNVDLPVKFMAAMRSDFLYLISSELGERISEPLISSRLYHLREFDETRAEEIISRSARRAGLPFEEGFSSKVARDLASQEVVSPSELQIVGEQLQRKRIYTQQAYKRAGGKEPLVHGFLEDVIQASGDMDGARLLLRSLISEENTRLTLTIDQISRRTQRGAGSVERLLRLFVEARLIREIQEDEPWRYELMHEYLIERINRITGQVMDATQRANRQLRQYLANYSVDRRTRIPVSKLWFIKRHSDLQLGEREREFLKRSVRRGLLSSAAAFLSLAMVAAAAAAAMSVSEEWEGIRLTDGHTAAARKAVFSPDGHLLITCGEDGRVIVWDFAQRQRLATFDDTGGWVNSVAFSPDGKWFAATGAGNTVAVWDAARLEKATVLRGHLSAVYILAFSPDGRWLSSTSGDQAGRTIVWETSTWGIAHDFDRAMTWGDESFSPGGDRLLLGSEIWDLKTKSRINILDPDPGFCAFSRDQRLLVGADQTGAVTFFDAAQIWKDGKAPVIKTQRVHRYHGRAVAVSPDGRVAASAAEDIVLWDAVTKAKLARLNYSAQVWSLAFSPDGRSLVSTHDDGAVLLWDVAERELVASFNGHSASVHSVAFSPDGRHLASASEDRSVIIWDAKTNEKEAILAGHTNRVTAVAFSPGGELLASSDMESNLFIWDMTDRKLKWETRYLYGKNWIATYCLAFSPDGRYLAATPGVYDVSSGRQLVDFYELVRTRKIPWGGTYGVAFSPDGRRLACATDQGYVLVWDVETWELMAYVKRSATPLISLSFAPDGDRLVTGDDEGAVRLWEVSPLREIALLGRHEARIKSVMFSPDGSQVASSGDDQMISLWDVGGRRLISHIGTHTAPVLSVAFSPDGKRLACGEQEKSVRIFTRHRALWGFRLD